MDIMIPPKYKKTGLKGIAMKKSRLICFLVLSALLPGFAQAVSVRPLVGINAEFGGDTLMTVVFSDGTSQDVKAGQGFSLFGGAALKDLFNTGEFGIDVQGTLGVKYSTIQEASNGSVDFFRFPVELLILGDWNGFRFGGGPCYHFANSLSASGVLSAGNLNFDDALGVTGQIDYTIAGHWNIGARYTAISYKPQVAGVSSVSANNFGVELGYFFF